MIFKITEIILLVLGYACFFGVIIHIILWRKPSPAILWNNIMPGAQINLKGIPYQVVQIIGVQKNLFIELTGPTNETRWLMVKIDNKTEVHIYKRPAKFNAGNRADFINRNERWIFQPPLNPDEFRLNDLLYTKDFEWDGVKYRKHGADLTGEAFERPQLSGPQQLATIAEYIVDEWITLENSKVKAKNPEAILLEIGPADDKNGGLIWLLIGNMLELSDVKISATTASLTNSVIKGMLPP